MLWRQFGAAIDMLGDALRDCPDDLWEELPRIYTRAELLHYLDYCRRKCQETISALSRAQAYRVCRFAWGELPFAELLLYTLRHVQEHAAHLRMFLGQRAGTSPGWVSQAQ
jgi:DinB family protein